MAKETIVKVVVDTGSAKGKLGALQGNIKKQEKRSSYRWCISNYLWCC